MESSDDAVIAGPWPEGLSLRRVGEKGRGVFCTRSFPAGSEVLAFDGDIKDASEFSNLEHALQVGPRDFISPSGMIDDYVNHSCVPNTGVRQRQDGRVVLFALRTLQADEEVTFDYATTSHGGHENIDNCACGALQCRGCIGDFVDLPADVQKKYLELDAVLPYLKQL